MDIEGSRDTLTIITEGEKDLVVVGFKLLGDDPPLFDPLNLTFWYGLVILMFFPLFLLPYHVEMIQCYHLLH